MRNVNDLVANAKQILELIVSMNISSDGNNKMTCRKVNFCRKYGLEFAQQQNIIAPGLTSSVATALLKVGFCQELSQLFLLEYCLKYKKQNVCFITLGAQNFSNDNHILGLIGDYQVPDHLIMGTLKNSPEMFLPQVEKYLPLEDFFKSNPDCVLADALINKAGKLVDVKEALMKYCQEHKITHVTAVRPFHNTPNLVENAPNIKANAVSLAQQLQSILTIKDSIQEKVSHSIQTRVEAPKKTDDAKSDSPFKKYPISKNRLSYFQELQGLVGKSIVNIDLQKLEVALPIAWLKELKKANQLKDHKGFDELAEHLDIDKSKLTF